MLREVPCYPNLNTGAALLLIAGRAARDGVVYSISTAEADRKDVVFACCLAATVEAEGAVEEHDASPVVGGHLTDELLAAGVDEIEVLPLMGLVVFAGGFLARLSAGFAFCVALTSI